ncbi:MAG TPA: C4-type zinc ribbon domain-containing protein [Acidimicrobiales bacterium]|jgi:predicted  nucleic acid-binding Zn-ribbon protein|nr:C4-type zinc ribbon domain-containing protein [Acidimicrobiales bacterium]
MTALETLLAVQDRDTMLDQLRHRRATLPERAALAAAQSGIVAVDAALVDARAVRDEAAGRQAGMEAEIATAESRIIEVEKRLYGGTVSASRELTAMAEEVEHLKARRSTLEDRVLEVMEEREPLDAEVDRLTAERAGLEAQEAAVVVALAAAEAAVDDEIKEVAAARAAEAEALPADLAATYEKLRSKLGGVGAARLTGSSCSGCHLMLPATELERVRRASPDALVFCDQCGRILVH